MVELLEYALGNVHREIANALEVGNDFQRGGDEAQVRGDRLAARQDAQTELVVFHLEAVDVVVGEHGIVGQGIVAPDGERLHRVAEMPDADARAEQKDFLTQPTELVFVFPIRMILNHDRSPRAQGMPSHAVFELHPNRNDP